MCLCPGYLHSRPVSERIDGVHSTECTLLLLMDVTAVHWFDDLFAVSQQWNQ